jgi:hypothetical protein
MVKKLINKLTPNDYQRLTMLKQLSSLMDD